ncbi:hypothetical protein SLA2020_109610 [Shorea laevis]
MRSSHGIGGGVQCNNIPGSFFNFMVVDVKCGPESWQNDGHRMQIVPSTDMINRIPWPARSTATLRVGPSATRNTGFPLVRYMS